MDTEKRIYLLVGLIFFLIVPSWAFAQQKVELKMMTGPTGGSWIPLGDAIAEAIRKEIPDVSSMVCITFTSRPDRRQTLERLKIYC